MSNALIFLIRWGIPLASIAMAACTGESSTPAPEPTDDDSIPPPDDTLLPPECAFGLKTSYLGAAFEEPFFDSPQTPEEPVDTCEYKVMERNRGGYQWQDEARTHALASNLARFDSHPAFYLREDRIDICRENRSVCETGESYWDPRREGGTLSELSSQEPVENPTWGFNPGEVFVGLGLLSPDEALDAGALGIYKLEYRFTHLPEFEGDRAVADITLTVYTTTVDAAPEGITSPFHYSESWANESCRDEEGIPIDWQGQPLKVSTFSQGIHLMLAGPLRFQFTAVQLIPGFERFLTSPVEGCMLIDKELCEPVVGLPGFLIDAVEGALVVDCRLPEDPQP